eukprot:1146487-Pelagomonas_calceolata.AAC.10
MTCTPIAPVIAAWHGSYLAITSTTLKAGIQGFCKPQAWNPSSMCMGWTEKHSPVGRANNISACPRLHVNRSGMAWQCVFTNVHQEQSKKRAAPSFLAHTAHAHTCKAAK